MLVNISNDGWYGDSGAYAQHLKQARMRAIENDRWLLRDTNTGVTAAIDPYGRVVANCAAQNCAPRCQLTMRWSTKPPSTRATATGWRTRVR